MPLPFLEIPTASGRTIERLRVSDDPPYGREIHIKFTDGTSVSIDLEIQTRVRAKHYCGGTGGDLRILGEREESRDGETFGIAE